jgi:hypothetical protein
VGANDACRAIRMQRHPRQIFLGAEREGYNRLMDCVNSGKMRKVQAMIARATVALAAASPSHASHIVGAKDKAARGAVR